MKPGRFGRFSGVSSSQAGRDSTGQDGYLSGRGSRGGVELCLTTGQCHRVVENGQKLPSASLQAIPETMPPAPACLPCRD